MADPIFRRMGSVIKTSVESLLTKMESKVSTFVAEHNVRYFIDTTGGIVTATLPSTPTENDTIEFIDLKGNFENNKLIIGRNGQKIMRLDEDMDVNINNMTVKLVFSGVTDGWIII